MYNKYVTVNFNIATMEPEYVRYVFGFKAVTALNNILLVHKTSQNFKPPRL